MDLARIQSRRGSHGSGLSAGVIYERASEQRDAKRFPQVGRSVDIGGRSLNIFCSGEGGPTVVFESEAGFPGYEWVFIQRETAKFARACWYDRAGYGWSDPGPFPHHSDSDSVIAALRDFVKQVSARSGDGTE